MTVSSGHRGLAAPNDAGYLGQVVVRPDARGRGIGRALGEQASALVGRAGLPEHGHRLARDQPALLRAWPALGFEPTFLRLHRVVGY